MFPGRTATVKRNRATNAAHRKTESAAPHTILRKSRLQNIYMISFIELERIELTVWDEIIPSDGKLEIGGLNE